MRDNLNDRGEQELGQEALDGMRHTLEHKIEILDIGLSNSRLLREEFAEVVAKSVQPPSGSALEDDLRYQMFTRLDNALLANRQLIVGVLEAYRTGALWKMGGARSVGSTHGRTMMLMRVMLPTLNWAFLSSWFGIYEDGVRRLLVAHGHVPEGKAGDRQSGYKLQTAARHLLPETSPWDGHFGIARRVRNSIHFGGVFRTQHPQEAGEYSYKGHDFVFEDGEPVEIPKVVGTTILGSWAPVHWQEMATASAKALPDQFVPGLPENLRY